VSLGEASLLFIGGVGTLSFVLGVAHVPLRWPVLIVVSVAVIAIVVLKSRKRPRSQFPWLATVVMSIPFIAVFADALLLPLADWDGLITWMPKARAIAAGGSLYAPYFYGAAGINFHNHYPLLLPIDASMILRLPQAVRVFYAVIPLAMLLMLRTRLAMIFRPEPAAWIAAIVAWIPTMTIGYGSATSAYADLAVAAFAGRALLALLGPVPWECAPWLAFLVLTKNEGLVLALAILVTAAIMRSLRTMRQWLIAVAPMAIALLALFVWRSAVPDAYDERYASLVYDLPHRLDRLPAACGVILRYMVDIRHWGLLWPAAMLAFVLALRSRVASIAALFLAVALTGYALAFTVTSWSVAELARVTADRLLLHLLVPLACLLAAGWDALTVRATRS
jgi:hypothetical protein